MFRLFPVHPTYSLSGGLGWGERVSSQGKSHFQSGAITPAPRARPARLAPSRCSAPHVRPTAAWVQAWARTPPRTLRLITGCDLATDIERIVVYRVDRTAGTCMVLRFTQGTSLCNGRGLVSGTWCLTDAEITADVASCDKHQTPSNVTAAVTLSGSFSFLPQTGRRR